MSNEEFIDAQGGEVIAISQIKRVCIHAASDKHHVVLWGEHATLLITTSWLDPLEALSFLNEVRTALGLPEYTPPVY